MSVTQAILISDLAQQIESLTAQLAEAKASAEAWQENCRLTEDELERERDRHADTIGKLAEVKTANQSMHDMILEIRKHFNAWDTPKAPTEKDIVDCIISSHNKQLAERDGAITCYNEVLGELREENATMREEVEKLREANRQLAGAAICPDHLKPESVRKQTAQECFEIGNKLLQKGYTATVISKYMHEIQSKFGLEG